MKLRFLAWAYGADDDELDKLAMARPRDMMWSDWAKCMSRLLGH